MNPLVIAGAIAVYLVLALLLLSLNLASLWKWWIKAGAIVVTLVGLIVMYLSMTGLVGWPTTTEMPKRFSLLATRIVEPDKLKGLPGHIYLWAEEVDDKQIVIGLPRNYEVPYHIETASDVATAQQDIDGGGKVLGQFAATGSEEVKRDADAKQAGGGTVDMNAAGKLGSSNGGGEGAETIGDPSSLSFSEMPPVDLPDKGAVTQIGQ